MYKSKSLTRLTVNAILFSLKNCSQASLTYSTPMTFWPKSASHAMSTALPHSGKKIVCSFLSPVNLDKCLASILQKFNYAQNKCKKKLNKKILKQTDELYPSETQCVRSAIARSSSRDWLRTHFEALETCCFNLINCNLKK